MAAPHVTAPSRALVGTMWFLASAFLSTWANTAFLREFGCPVTHALVRFSSSAAIGLASIAIRKPGGVSLGRVPALMRELWLPAMFLLGANLLNSFALQLSGITLCYVVKSSIPVLTVAYCVARGERFSGRVYASLVPTVVGVALASAADSSFSVAGFAAALGSTLSQTALNLVSKAQFAKLGIDGPLAQTVLTSCCTLGTLPLYACSAPLPASKASVVYAAFLFACAGLSYHLEYSLNFMFIQLVSPLAFSVADVARRVAIILAGALIFRKPVSPLNALGAALAFGGVLCFVLASSAHASKQGSQKDRQA